MNDKKINLDKANAKKLEITTKKIQELLNIYSNNEKEFKLISKQGVTESRIKIELFEKNKITGEFRPVIYYKTDENNLLIYVRTIRIKENLEDENLLRKNNAFFQFQNKNIIFLDTDYWTLGEVN